MLGKAALVTTTALIASMLCACASGSGGQTAPNANVSVKNETSASQTEEYDPMVKSIDLALDDGSIAFDHVEKANAKLTDSNNALVFVFKYTNKQSKPAQAQSTFRCQFFQNGAELKFNGSYSSEGGDQYELVSAFHNDALKSGTVTFGTIVVPKDDSPITVMVSQNGARLKDNYQTMEVEIDKLDDVAESSSVKSSSNEKPKGEKVDKPKPKQISIGDTASNEQFSVTLTDARVDSTLSSSESSTYWEPNEGGAFVILEFDVTALTSDQLPVDDYAITDLVANYNEDTYSSWTLQYIQSQIWLYFRHTYLDANLPCHVYAYTTVPAEAINDGSLSVNMNLSGTPYTYTIR